MKKLLIALATLASCIIANADTWKLYEVKGKDHATVGYIYHTTSTGVTVGAKTIKSVTGLRFVCSLRGSEQVISIYWNRGLSSVAPIVVPIIDNAIVTTDQPTAWRLDGQLVYRNLYESQGLLQALKNSNMVKFRWVDNDATLHFTEFTLSGFDLTEFNKKCKTQP